MRSLILTSFANNEAQQANNTRSIFSRTTEPVILQRIESAGIAVFSLYLYQYFDANWGLFLLLILLPDLSILGYVYSKQLGAALYNVFHTYAAPLLVGGVMISLSLPFTLEIFLIWTAHIAIDRCMGYGLKFPTHFKHTHLSWK